LCFASLAELKLVSVCDQIDGAVTRIYINLYVQQACRATLRSSRIEPLVFVNFAAQARISLPVFSEEESRPVATRSLLRD
jgi:hypothetical protein